MKTNETEYHNTLLFSLIRQKINEILILQHDDQHRKSRYFINTRSSGKFFIIRLVLPSIEAL